MIRAILFSATFIINSLFSLAQIKSEDVTINNQAIQLPGTLTYTKENSPLIIWVHGSGAVDRNGAPSNYIKQFREAINKKEIAFFSYDKRTINPKNAPFLKDGIYISDFIFDVQEVVSYFKKNNRFSKIILAGHSQGSLIAMKALDGVDKLISLAGAGETIDKTLVRQLTAQNTTLGATALKHFKELKNTGEIKEVNPSLISIFAKPNQAFWLSWIELDPIKEIRKTNTYY